MMGYSIPNISVIRVWNISGSSRLRRVSPYPYTIADQTGPSASIVGKPLLAYRNRGPGQSPSPMAQSPRFPLSLLLLRATRS